MKAPDFLSTLRGRDIQVWAEGERLRCSAPKGVLTPELQAELRQHKAEILSFLASAGSLARQRRAIVPLQPRGTLTPIFAFGGHNGDVFCFRSLARHLGETQPFFGLQPPGLDGQSEPLDRVESFARYFAAEIRAFRPNGPYVIAGFCAGGTIAFELARQLMEAGAAIQALALFGAPFPTAYRRWQRLRKRMETQVERLLKHIRTIASLPLAERHRYILEKFRGLSASGRDAALNPALHDRNKVARATFAALRRYQPGWFPGRLRHFLPCDNWARSREQPLRWRSLASDVEEYFGPPGCSTDVMLLEPHAPLFARLYRAAPENAPIEPRLECVRSGTFTLGTEAPSAAGI